MNFPTQSWFMTPKLGYIKKVLTPKPSIGYAPSSLIGFWPQNEKFGVISYDYSGLDHHGQYTGVTLGEPGVPGMGMTSPLFDGVGDFNDIYSVDLNTYYDQSELSVQIWFKVLNAGIWTDGTIRKLFRLFVSNDNTLKAERDTANNVIAVKVEHATVNKFLGWTTIGAPTTWQNLIITISQSNDRIFLYGNGAQEDTAVGLGIWAGPLSATETLIGSLNTGGLSHNWSGLLSNMTLWNEELTPEVAKYLSTP